jgi:hypothetical protein
MNSRWSTHPIKRGGEIVSIRPNTPGDIEILKTLGTYTTPTVPDIAALNQRSYGAVIARVNLLKRKPNELIQVHRAQAEHARMYQWASQALHLTPKAIAKLQEIGFEPAHREPSHHFLHQLTENQVAASFEIGARERFISFRKLLKSSHTPEETKESAESNTIPVAFHYKGKDYAYDLIPDALPLPAGSSSLRAASEHCRGARRPRLSSACAPSTPSARTTIRTASTTSAASSTPGYRSSGKSTATTPSSNGAHPMRLIRP